MNVDAFKHVSTLSAHLVEASVNGAESLDDGLNATEVDAFAGFVALDPIAKPG
jgi:hypothetical protein